MDREIFLRIVKMSIGKWGEFRYSNVWNEENARLGAGKSLVLGSAVKSSAVMQGICF